MYKNRPDISLKHAQETSGHLDPYYTTIRIRDFVFYLIVNVSSFYILFVTIIIAMSFSCYIISYNSKYFFPTFINLFHNFLCLFPMNVPAP